MSELQESVDSVDQSPEVEETPNQGSELAPETPEVENKDAEVEQKESNQKAINRAINKQHRKFQEEKRRADELEQRLKKFESERPDVQTEIPPMPDEFDEDFKGKLARREEALLNKARNDALKMQQEERRAMEQRDNERREFERLQAMQSQFNESAKRLGVEQKALDEAQDILVDYGVSGDLANILLKDSDGPLVVQYLAANPLDLHDIVNANPYEAGVLLASAKSKASSLKPKTSSAPDPATVLEGRGVPKKERGPKGATFE